MNLLKKLDFKKISYISSNYDVSLFPLVILTETLAFHYHKIIGQDFGNVVGEWVNRNNKWAVEKDKFEQIARKSIRKIEKDKIWVKKSLTNLDKKCKKLIDFTTTVFNLNLKNKSDKELYQLYADYRKKFIDMYLYGWLPNAIEGPSNLFSEKLKKYLEKKLASLDKLNLLGEYFFVLTTSLKFTIREKEQIDFLNLLARIKTDKNKTFVITSAIDKLFVNHAKKYCWLPFDYEGEIWDKEYFVEQARLFFERRVDPNNELTQKIQARRDLINKQKIYKQEVGLLEDREYDYLFKTASELMWWKNERKDILYKTYYHIDKLIREIAKRLSLAPAQTRHILPQEMKSAIINKKYDPGLLNQRIKHCIVVLANTQISVYTDKNTIDWAQKFFKRRKPKNNIKELAGQTAFSGKARGKVKIINTVADINKMENGNILVSNKTAPILVPAMKKAAAIVTDAGGIICHAAIMSRELKIPCVIGTQIATQVLKDGDMVKVDANQGVIIKLK